MKNTHALFASLVAAGLLGACASSGGVDSGGVDSGGVDPGGESRSASLTGSGPDGEVHWLFVQSAQDGTFDGTRLTLDDPGPTVFFSDRPMRIDGHMSAERFVDSWDQGANSFASDPPNAVLSILGGDGPSTAVVELRNPKLVDGDLSFEVAVQDGEIPESFGQVALFIDSMGIAGPTLGLGMNQAAEGAMFQPRMDLAGPDAYYRTFAPHEADPLNPNLVPREDRGQGYRWAYDQEGPPKMELGSTKMGLSSYYGD